MSAPSVQVETHGAVALVTLNRPEHSNTLNLQMAMDLLAAAMACARNDAVRAVVLTGAGRNFSFGGDLRAMPARELSLDGHIRELTTYLHAAISHFVRMDAPVIAAVNGTAAGAGVGLVTMGPGARGAWLEVQPRLYRRRTQPRRRHLLPAAAHRRPQARHGAAAAQS